MRRPQQKNSENFKKHACEAQTVLRSIGQLSITEGMNQTEIVNLVSEGVKQALAEQDELVPTAPTAEHANAVQTPDPVQEQLTEMRNLIT